jgi:hypothetical protein
LYDILCWYFLSCLVVCVVLCLMAHSCCPSIFFTLFILFYRISNLAFHSTTLHYTIPCNEDDVIILTARHIILISFILFQTFSCLLILRVIHFKIVLSFLFSLLLAFVKSSKKWFFSKEEKTREFSSGIWGTRSSHFSWI